MWDASAACIPARSSRASKIAKLAQEQLTDSNPNDQPPHTQLLHDESRPGGILRNSGALAGAFAY
jgi:hypothetical protein